MAEKQRQKSSANCFPSPNVHSSQGWAGLQSGAWNSAWVSLWSARTQVPEPAATACRVRTSRKLHLEVDLGLDPRHSDVECQHPGSI